MLRGQYLGEMQSRWRTVGGAKESSDGLYAGYQFTVGMSFPLILMDGLG
jgi:hypothetical protein